MKRNILYLAGALLSSAILTFGCSEDIPTYSELTVDKNEVFIQADGETPTATVNITGGNGNYKISTADESIATATLNETAITVNGLKNGTTTVTVIDWSKHSAIITIKVKEDFDLTLDVNEEDLKLKLAKDETRIISILSGNGGYGVKSSDETIATAILNEEGKIEITGINAGTATVTVTDADGKKVDLHITVS